MNHGALFNGIGGFQLAAEWIGWNNIMSCEIDKFCSDTTKKLFPNCVQHGDIKTTDFTIYRGKIDVLSGGDPCQPNSIAGLRKGKNDVRFLWPQKFRAIREIQPPFVVNENVGGSVTNGILDIKIDDLEHAGYSCQAYNLSAEAFGALHQRERIWLVAYHADFYANNRKSIEIQRTSNTKKIQEWNNIQYPCEPVDLRNYNTDTDTERFKKQYASKKSEVLPKRVSGYFGFGNNAHGNFSGDEIKSGIIRMLNGLPEGMDYTERNKRIKALGNAIVPQEAYEIFKAIDNHENTLDQKDING